MTHFEYFRQWFNYLYDTDKIDPRWPIQPNLAHATLISVINELERRKKLANALIILDLDKTCRTQPWSNIFQLRFGEMTPEELKLLEHIRRYAHRLLVVTDQTLGGHYIAALCSWLHEYEAFPQALVDREIQVLGAQPGSIPGFSPPYKTTQQALEETTAALRDSQLPKSIVVVGDMISDIRFANELFLYLCKESIITATFPFSAYLLTSAVLTTEPQQAHSSLQLALL